MSAQVAVYVQSEYAKKAYAVESYNVRAWPGLEMICHVLRQAGIEVDYCSSATAGRYKVVLVSITSGCDWLPFIGERVRWPAAWRPTIVAGGAGLLNVRPSRDRSPVKPIEGQHERPAGHGARPRPASHRPRRNRGQGGASPSTRPIFTIFTVTTRFCRVARQGQSAVAGKPSRAYSAWRLRRRVGT